MAYKFKEREITGVFEILPHHVSDNRGYVFKEYDKDRFSESKIEFAPIESMLIFSEKNVLRGIHYQRIEEQDRLIRCISGCVWAVVVDLRLEGGNVKKWINVDINDGKEVYIPKGCAFGTFALQDAMILCMYGSNRFHAEYASGIRWDDDTLAIEWPFCNEKEIVMSEVDRNWMSYKDYVDGLKI